MVRWLGYLQWGDYSIELCGGTHVNRTGDIGVFKIISEAGISSGTRRIEALTGLTAIEEIRSNEGYLDEALDLVRAPKQDLRSRIAQLISDVKDKEKEIEELKLKIAASASTDLAEKIVDISGTPFLASEIVGDNKAMMKMLDDLRSKHPRSNYCIGAARARENISRCGSRRRAF